MSLCRTVIFVGALLSATAVATPGFAQSQTCDDADFDGDGFSCKRGDCDDGDAAINPDAPELCDGIDNNCNGTIDDVDGDSDGVACNQGDCDDNDPQVHPGRAEVCDGKDNDCDTLIDERNGQGDPLRQDCYTGPSGTEGVGLCEGGQVECTNGAFPTTAAACVGQTLPAATESCDNVDHDCDGNPFNGFDNDQDGDGHFDCLDCPDIGGDTDPDIHPGRAEICDGKDNDCDGRTDERNSSGAPLRTSCYTGPNGSLGVGVCKSGYLYCTGGAWPAETPANCDGQVLPAATESCDSVDHDCDGNPYNGLENDQDGDGYFDCLDCPSIGGATDPDIRPNASEICDGKDNDCDGRTDERNGAGDPLRRTCYTGPNGTAGVGLCETGYLYCTGGDWPDETPANCDGEVVPVAETCDTQDRDCDGNPYNGWEFDFDGDGFFDCLDCFDIGGHEDPTIHPNATEICDGEDNDCDGDVDERNSQGDPLRQRCYTGPGDTYQRGRCQRGYLYCTDGDWPAETPANCDGEVVPIPEICNQIDDDCDGSTDEDYDQDGDSFVDCDPDAPIEDCDDSDPEVYPGRPEICDGKDNDCDSLTDEQPNGSPLTEACYSGSAETEGVGQCVAGYLACQGAAGYGGMCIDEVVPSADDPCDGVDNDCDGTVDEGFDLDGDGFTSCGGDCNDNDAAVKPGALEVCNNVDDDCDGTVDGNDTACYTGPVGTATVGACHPGTAVCVAGQPAGACQNQQLPVPEVCDGIDNDCDGLVDEDFDLDADGIATCAGDCDDANPFVAPGLPERCDCVDNDCDAQVDEGGPNGSVCRQGACHDFDDDGYSNCDGDCDDLRSDVYPTAPEVCGDAVDNDCDGVIDENVDEDQDGITTCDGDCDDRIAAINPSAPEVCDGFDNDCDDEIDEGFDQDGDGVTTCAGDCDDNDARRSPLEREVCDENDIDEDCDGRVDPDDDADGDGHTVCDGDCNDFNPTVYPGAPEICDGHDNDCNGPIDEGFNQDGDRFAVCFGDCDDNDPNINPFAREVVDGIDNNCDGRIDEGQEDNDGDGFSYLCGDCDDSNPAINPHAMDRCDGADNDCDGQLDRTPWGVTSCAMCNDSDGDGVTDCDGDCADDDPTVHPGITEVCNGRDDDCDGTVDRDRFLGHNLCLATGDAGTRPGSDAEPNDGSVPDAADPSAPDAGVPTGPNDTLAPEAIDYGCGCSTGTDDGVSGVIVLALVGLLAGLRLRARQRPPVPCPTTERPRDRRRPPGSFVGLLLLAASSNACTGFALDEAVAGLDAGTPDAALVPIDAGAPDAGETDAGVETSYLEGPCRIVGPGQIELHRIPSGGFQMAVHPGTEVTPVPDADALGLTDVARGLYGFVLRAPLDPDLDPSDPLSASRWIERYVAQLFADPLPGIIGVADRVDETLNQVFSRPLRSAARSLRTVTMVNDVAPSQVRAAALADLSGTPLADLSSLPRPELLSPTRTFNLVAYAETEPEPAGIRAIIALAGDTATASASTRLSDLSTGSHIGPAGLPTQVGCKAAVAEALRVDFLWVVDNSESMLEEQQALAAAADQFFVALSRSRIDFRLGVASTDGEVLRGGGFTRDVDEFRQRVQVGVNGHWREEGLEFAVRAVERARTATEAVERLRDDAVPVLVFFSDEDSANLASVSSYAATLAQQGVLAFAIVGPRPRGCIALGRGAARAGESYIQVVELLGGSSASICAEDLAQPINEILVAAAGAASEIGLDAVPIAGSVEVALPDTLIPRSRIDGFDYTPIANTVLFFGNASPPVGTPFRISYSTFAEITR